MINLHKGLLKVRQIEDLEIKEVLQNNENINGRYSTQYVEKSMTLNSKTQKEKPINNRINSISNSKVEIKKEELKSSKLEK